jgi:hypothetical protein
MSSEISEELLQALADELVAGVKEMWDAKSRSKFLLGSKTFCSAAGELYFRRAINSLTKDVTELQIARVSWCLAFQRKGLWKKIEAQLQQAAGRWTRIKIENVFNDDFAKYLEASGWQEEGDTLKSYYWEMT